jgi:mRNA interferase HigB
MRIISWSKLKRFWQRNQSHGRAQRSLEQWYDVVRRQAWRNPSEVKATFGKNVDFVESDKGSDLAVFNIHANHYRLIAAIHYLTARPANGRVYVLRILSHAEYDEEDWKREL